MSITSCLETKRLRLCVVGEEYAPLVLDYYQRNRHFLQPWEYGYPEEFYTLVFQSRQLLQERRAMEEGRMLRLWLFKKEDSECKQTIGTFSFQNIIRGAFLSCHLGYKLDQQETGQGYMQEALKEGISFVFKEYGLHRIEANIMPSNIRSLRVAEKLGFYREGLARDYLKINGKWEDHVHMGLLNAEVK